jgi:hypothetical protein
MAIIRLLKLRPKRVSGRLLVVGGQADAGWQPVTVLGQQTPSGLSPVRHAHWHQKEATAHRPLHLAQVLTMVRHELPGALTHLVRQGQGSQVIRAIREGIVSRLRP